VIEFINNSFVGIAVGNVVFRLVILSNTIFRRDGVGITESTGFAL
jgi:hypothetical protein